MLKETALREINDGERSLIDWQYRSDMMGHFETALWKAISHADTGNLDLLAKGFPEHVEAYRNYTQVGGWWQSLVSYAKETGVL